MEGQLNSTENQVSNTICEAASDAGACTSSWQFPAASEAGACTGSWKSAAPLTHGCIYTSQAAVQAPGCSDSWRMAQPTSACTDSWETCTDSAASGFTDSWQTASASSTCTADSWETVPSTPGCSGILDKLSISPDRNESLAARSQTLQDIKDTSNIKQKVNGRNKGKGRGKSSVSKDSGEEKLDLWDQLINKYVFNLEMDHLAALRNRYLRRTFPDTFMPLDRPMTSGEEKPEHLDTRICQLCGSTDCSLMGTKKCKEY